MAEKACTTTDGSVMCGMPDANGATACGCAQENAARTPKVSFMQEVRAEKRRGVSKIWSGVAFAAACATSPCCTPLYVPLLMIGLAGTPIAAWMGQNLGWVYSLLTFVSVGTLVLAFGLRKRNGQAQRGQVTERQETHANTGYSKELSNA